MLNSLKLFVAAALVAVASPLIAQDTATPEPAAPSSQEFDLGTPVDDTAPRPGEPYVREVFGDWALRCLVAEVGEDPCQMYQLLLDPSENPVAEISIVPLADGGPAVAGVVVVVPLETLLTEQLTLSIDGGEARRYAFNFCNRAGCVARFGLTDEQVALLKRGASGVLTIVPAAVPDQQINLTMSLIGFTAGFDAATATAN
ncbi:MAG: invasion associated locus B family protein [Flavimaricola sp.]|nr:invasion associated locus B family protein [Flavimaricola sp.]